MPFFFGSISGNKIIKQNKQRIKIIFFNASCNLYRASEKAWKAFHLTAFHKDAAWECFHCILSGRNTIYTGVRILDRLFAVSDLFLCVCVYRKSGLCGDAPVFPLKLKNTYGNYKLENPKTGNCVLK